MLQLWYMQGESSKFWIYTKGTMYINHIRRGKRKQINRMSRTVGGVHFSPKTVPAMDAQLYWFANLQPNFWSATDKK